MAIRQSPLFALILMISLIFILSNNGAAQIRYSGRLEAGYLPYLARTLTVDPGPNWKGYPLKSNQNGIELSAINGVRFKEKLFIGAGVGYLNYQGLSGYSIFGNVEYLVTRKKLSPLLNFRAGSSKIYNQYENGSTTGTLAFNFGLNYKATKKINLNLQGGIAFAFGASFTPIRFGIGF